MITVLKTTSDANGIAMLEFRADRAYDVYALEGHNSSYNGEADIVLVCASGAVVYAPGNLNALILKQGVTCSWTDQIHWSGHLVLLDGDVLGMRAQCTGPGSVLVFKILLIPMAIVKETEKEAEKEWLP